MAATLFSVAGVRWGKQNPVGLDIEDRCDVTLSVDLKQTRQQENREEKKKELVGTRDCE